MNSRENIINFDLLNKLKSLAKNYPNDADFGRQARKHIIEAEEIIKNLAKEMEENESSGQDNL